MQHCLLICLRQFPSKILNIVYAIIDIWKAKPETKDIAKLQQQYSDLKQWGVKRAARTAETKSSENTEGTSSEDDVHVQSTFSLLEQEG